MKNSSGFTLVEILVTIVVTSIFLLSAFQLSGTIQQLSVSGNQASIADALAYSNMRIYANGQSPATWFTCGSNPATPVVLLNSTSAVSGVPNPILQHVEATAPYGCGGSLSDMPIRVESYVQYGSTNRKVTHATFVSY